MKTLKGFVRQRAHPEGSMAEGWLVQESLVLITEILGSSNPGMPQLWSQETNIRVIGEQPQGQGVMKKMDNSLQEEINKFCILNLQSMEKWIEKYKETKRHKNAQVSEEIERLESYISRAPQNTSRISYRQIARSYKF